MSLLSILSIPGEDLILDEQREIAICSSLKVNGLEKISVVSGVRMKKEGKFGK